ncbi:MAG TPA: hypothetical protein VME45_05710 [Stellaceae bacterium]|nr:hypothetical protein [Stellaceae bacterium]
MCGDEVQDLGKLLVPTDQLGNRLRQVCRRRRRFALGHCHTGAGALIGNGRQNADPAGELISAPGHRADQLAVGAQRSAQRRDLGLQRVFLDDPVGPDARHQRVLGDDGAASLEQRQQHVKGAATELQRPAVGEQFAALRRQEETPESCGRRWFGNRIHRSPSQTDFAFATIRLQKKNVANNLRRQPAIEERRAAPLRL